MLGATILFDPLPVGRIGIRRDTEEVIVANDFSTFAWMMKEFVSNYYLPFPDTYSFGGPQLSLMNPLPRLRH